MKSKRILALILAVVCLVPFTGCGNRHEQENTTPSPELTPTATVSATPSAAVDNPPEETPATGNQEDLAAPVFEGDKPSFSRAYVPIEYSASVAPYTVKQDLSNIENKDQFGAFTEEQKKLLARNGFVVTGSTNEQLFYIYETNEYMELPSFITTDSVLQVYHVFFDYSLRQLEANKLLPKLEELTTHMLDKSIKLYNQIENAQVKHLALSNIAYFAVAQMALEGDVPKDIPKEALDLAKQEFKLIDDAQGFLNSPLMDVSHDYSQYKPRGHYTRSNDFKRYFKAMMWYGQVPFNLLNKDNGVVTLDKEPTAKALLITYTLFMGGIKDSDRSLWADIYDPIVYYVGSSDDLTIYDYKDLLIKAFGENPDVNTFLDEDKAAALLEEAQKLPEPQIQPKWVSVNAPTGRQFRFMGQRYIPDSEILQTLCEPLDRPVPSGLDVMAVLGSDLAYDYLINDMKVAEQWPEYPDEFAKMKDKFSELSQTSAQSRLSYFYNMYNSWLWTLQTLLEPFGKGYPSFMTNKAWENKSLSTALASWSELRHDTILYGKQSGAEGGGEWPPITPCYVEPNVELYSRLLWLTATSRENLSGRGLLPEDLRAKMEYFEELLAFLRDCSIKQLRNEVLSEDEYRRLMEYGSTLEYLTGSMAEEGLRWFEITSETDKNMAVVADVHTTSGGYLEEGVGTAAEIFVVVPIDGKLYLTRGAVFDHYEFMSGTRLTDEEWQAMLKEGNQPEQAPWVSTYKNGEKSEIPAPNSY
jgi:hypothetical protein